MLLATLTWVGFVVLIEVIFDDRPELADGGLVFALMMGVAGWGA